MSTINLMILGILKYRPINAYEIVKVIKDYKIDKWIKITAPSVYLNLRKMKEKGYLDGEIIKDSEAPERTIYSITGKGDEYYESLMKKYSSCPPPSYENYLPFISNLVHMEERREEGLDMLKALRNSFNTQIDEIDFFRKKLPGNATLYDKTILDLYHKILHAKLEWLDEMEAEYAENGYGRPKV